MIKRKLIKKLLFLFIFGVQLTACVTPPQTDFLQEHIEEPAPESGVWQSIGPGGGGWMTALAFAPPDTIYLGCDVGGVYRSFDGGETWQSSNTGLKNYVVNAIAVDPQNPHIVYLGTLGSVYKSVDGGNRWEEKREGFPPVERWSFSAPITSLAIDPSNPQIVYAGVGDAHAHRFGAGIIYKSEDGGETWRNVNQGTPQINENAILYSIAVHPSDSQILYAATDYGLYKSEDGGESWQAKLTGLPHADTRAVVIHPADPNTLYLSLHATPNQSPWQGGVYKSTDAAETWVAVNDGLGNHVGDTGDPPLMTSNYEHLAINPQEPEILYVGDISWWTAGLYKSENGGDSWSNTTTSINEDAAIWAAQAGPSIETLLLDPTNPERLFFGNSMEVYRSEDAGKTWAQAYTNETPPQSGWWTGRGFETTVVRDIALSNADTLYIGYQDTGFLRSEDGGKSFQQITQGLEDYDPNVFSLAVDPDAPQILYAGNGEWHTNEGEISRSEDFGKTWTVIGNPENGLPDARVHALVIDPASPLDERTLYAASYGYGVYKSVDGGKSWYAVNQGLGENGNRYVYTLSIDSTDSQTLYAGIEMPWEQVEADQYGGIYKTTNGGESWEKIDRDFPHVRAFALHPDNSQILYAGVQSYYDEINQQDFEGGLYQSTDGGATWERIFDSPEVSAIVIDPQNSQRLYLGTSDDPYHDHSTGAGVFRSPDGGKTWEAFNEGLDMLAINTLEITENALYAGTGGGGVYQWVFTDEK